MVATAKAAAFFATPMVTSLAAASAPELSVMSFNEACLCPVELESMRLKFTTYMALGVESPYFQMGLNALCADNMDRVMKAAREEIMDLSVGWREDVDAYVRQLQGEGTCLPALAIGAYSCMLDAWLSFDIKAFNRFSNIAVPLFVYSAGCLEPDRTVWSLTTGHAIMQLIHLLFKVNEVPWQLEPLPLCIQDINDPRTPLIGFCGAEMPHEIHTSIEPLEPISADDVVLCTHTSSLSLAMVEPMLESWRGPASIAVLSAGGPAPQMMNELRQWSHRMGQRGLRQIVVSLVEQTKVARNEYDGLYPANLLRQTAIDAAVADLVLLADPGFVPVAEFYSAISATSSLGRAMRTVSAAAPTAFLVTSFVVYEELQRPWSFSLTELRRFVESGHAVSFDMLICPLCKPYAWQWLLLMEATSLRFLEVEPGDLHHPAWLVSRSVLPRLPNAFHGLVGPRGGSQKVGWTRLPCGLKASVEQMRAAGVKLLLLPRLFLHRQDSLPLPEKSELGFGWFPPGFYSDMLFRYFVRSLPSMVKKSSMAHTFLAGGQLVDVLPPRPVKMFTLQQGSDQSLELIVMASTVLGSDELQKLLRSVPYTVHAVSVGAADYWAAAKEELPIILSNFQPDTLVAIVDAYDVILMPCSRSIASEFAAFGKDIVWAADTSCHPNPKVCTPCAARYPPDSQLLDDCRAFPHLNGGCYMGKAPALAHAFEWMRDKGHSIGRNDQEAKWNYYNAFPDKIAMDHRQRIFSCFFGSTPDQIQVEGCQVVSKHTGDEVCFAHANGGTKWTILAPLMQELESKGCLPKSPPRFTKPYAGEVTPSIYIWDR